MAKGRCMYCSKEDVELQLIESIFSYDPIEVAKFLDQMMGIDRDVVGDKGSDILTVCVAPCADVIREGSEVIIRDEVFTRG